VAKPIPKYPCAYCGRSLRADQMIYSAHTGNRFCAIDQRRCQQRGEAAKRKRIAEKRRQQREQEKQQKALVAA
jgi:hypothetical protein